jgi:myo-inositol-1-phosphate synthase
MAPIALDPATQQGHDSFTPAALRGVNGSNGVNDKEGSVHASARRTPEGGAFTVQAEGTKYDEEGIKARYVDRGSAVTRTSFSPFLA